MKIVAEYEPTTGFIYDKLGNSYNIGMSMQFDEVEEIKPIEVVTGLTVDDLVKLKSNGVI